MNTTSKLVTLLILTAMGAGGWILFRDEPVDAGPARGGPSDLVADDPAPTAGAAAGIETSPAPGDGDPADADPGPDLPPMRTVTIVDVGDRPVAGAHVALVEGAARVEGLVTPMGVTGEDGTIKLQPRGPEDRVVVVAAGNPPTAVPLPEDDSFTVELPRGLRLFGFLMVDGQRPVGPVEFELRGFVDASADWTPALRAARARLGRVRDGVVPMRTSSDGEFRFHGLPGAGPYTLHFPAHHAHGATEADRRNVLAHAPHPGLRIDLISLPGITGTPVGETGSVEVEAEVTRDDGTSYTLKQTTACGDRFRFVLRDDATSRVVVVVTRADGSRFARRFLVAGLDGPLDLGEIPPDPVRVLPVRVTGPDGPIQGARAVARGYESPKTDAKGWTDFRLPPETPRIWIGAPGYRVVSADVPPEKAGAVQVRLEREVRLAIEVSGESAGVPGLTVRLTAEGGPVFDARVTGAFDGTDLQGTRPRARTRGADGSETLSFDAGRPIELFGVRQGVPLVVELTDVAGHLIRSERLELSGALETQVRWQLDRAPRRVWVRVVDSRAEPVEGAAVQVGASLLTTDAEGYVALEGVFADVVRLVASKDGHALTVREDARVDDEVVTLLIYPARVVWVTVHDPDGKPVDGARVSMALDAPGAPKILSRGRREGPGLYRVPDAPAVTARVRVEVGDRSGDRLVTPETDRVTVVVE